MNGLPVSWLVNNWRLKLLSLALSLGIVGAVAFSQNPPVFDTVSARIQYLNLPQDLVVMNRPTTVDVPVAGLRDAVTMYRNTAAGVSIDLANARAGTNQAFAVTPKIDVAGVTARSRIGPIRLTVEPLVARQLDIGVRAPKALPGISVIQDRTYATCGNSNDRCQVTVSAAASIVDKLTAYVDYDVTLTTADPLISPNEPIKFELNGHQIDLAKDVKSLPTPSWTPSVVTIQVATHGSTLTRTVPLTTRITGTQACGYAITGLDVQPSASVTVTGPIDLVSKLTVLQLEPPIDVSGLTSSSTVSRRVQTGSSQIASDLSLVRVTVGISQAFSCAAPSPSPSR